MVWNMGDTCGARGGYLKCTASPTNGKDIDINKVRWWKAGRDAKLQHGG